MKNSRAGVKSLFLSLLFLFFLSGALAQVDSLYSDSLCYNIQMDNGNRYTGKIISEDSATLVFRSASLGIIRIQKEKIKFRSRIDDNDPIDQLNWYKNFIPQRYVLLPSSIFTDRMQKRIYYENRMVLVNNLHLQLTNGFSIAVGLMPVFVIEGTATPIWISPRFRIKTKNEKIHLATSIFYGELIFDAYSDGLSSLMSINMLTYGDKNLSFSIGAGYGLFEGLRMPGPALAFGGNMRLNKRILLSIETVSWNIGVSNREEELSYLTVLGGRVLWNKFALDFGVMLGATYQPDRLDLRFPYAGFFLPFGR